MQSTPHRIELRQSPFPTSRNYTLYQLVLDGEVIREQVSRISTEEVYTALEAINLYGIAEPMVEQLGLPSRAALKVVRRQPTPSQQQQACATPDNGVRGPRNPTNYIKRGFIRETFPAVLVKDCDATDWNGQYVCMAAGKAGTYADGTFTTLDGAWHFPVARDGVRMSAPFDPLRTFRKAIAADPNIDPSMRKFLAPPVRVPCHVCDSRGHIGRWVGEELVTEPCAACARRGTILTEPQQ